MDLHTHITVRPLLLAVAVCACWLSATSRASASPIVNGGFETGSFSGWTVDPAATGSFVFVGGHGHSGGDAAWFGAIGGADDTLTQSFATTPGESYTVSFWLAHGWTDSRNGFSAFWNTTPLLMLHNAPRFGQRQYTFLVTATGNTASIDFSGHALRDYFYLDDIAVTPIPTPEPSTFLLLLGGVATAVRLRRGSSCTGRS
jgi:hypothetical protein